jgi:hypothetical protein
MQTSARPNAVPVSLEPRLEAFWESEAEALRSVTVQAGHDLSETTIRLARAPGPLTWYVESDHCHGVDIRYWVLETCDGPKHQNCERPGLYHGFSTRFDDAGREWVRYFVGFMDDFGNLVEVPA